MQAAKFITDAIFDKSSGPWFLLSGPQGHKWISGSEYSGNRAMIFSMIAQHTGLMITSQKAKRQLDSEIEEAKQRAGMIASQTGWHGSTFVCGDRTCRPNASAVDAVTFQALAKFTPAGTLGEWQKAVGPFIEGQTLPYFVLALALTGPLLRFLPPGTNNPMVELVGEGKSGKSSLAALAASVWAGNPDKSEGGGEIWSMTANAFDVRRRDHRDMLLVLDEAESAAANSGDRRDLFKNVIFTGASTSQKARMTDKDMAPAPLRLALLSTSNTGLHRVLRSEPKERVEAANSRLLSIKVSQTGAPGFRIFDTVPAGFASTPGAVTCLRSAFNRSYGVAGPAFAEFIAIRIATDEDAFTAEVARRVSKSVRLMTKYDPAADIRHCTILAIVELAARLAIEGKILPRQWGSPVWMRNKLFRVSVAKSSDPETLARLLQLRFGNYVYSQLLSGTVNRYNTDPVSATAKGVKGFVVGDRRQDRELIIDSDYFRTTFEGATEYLKLAKSEGRLRHAPSEQKRLQTHPPKWMKDLGFRRVFAIRCFRRSNKRSSAQ